MQFTRDDLLSVAEMAGSLIATYEPWIADPLASEVTKRNAHRGMIIGQDLTRLANAMRPIVLHQKAS